MAPSYQRDLESQSAGKRSLRSMEAKRRISKLRISYSLLLAVYFGAWIISLHGDDRNWVVAAAGTGITGTLLPLSFIVIVILAIRKRWLDIGICSALTLLFFCVSGQLHLPPLTAQAKGSPTIRVMSFNVMHGWMGIEKVAQLVRRENVDAFAFQELGLGEDRGAIENLKTLLPDYRIFSDGSRTSGTRLPVVSEQTTNLTSNPYSWTLVEQVVLVGDKQVRLANVHAPSYLPSETFKRRWPDWFTRWGELSQEQTDLIETELEVIGKDSRPTLLCGDFNMTPIGRRYQIMASHGTDAFAARGAGCGWTSPSGIPMRRIDYIWAFNTARPLQTYVVDRRASDHAAVVSTVSIE